MLTREMLSSLLPVAPALGLIISACAILISWMFQPTSQNENSDQRPSNGWAWAGLAALIVVWGSWSFSGSTLLDRESTLFRSDVVSRAGTQLALLAGCLVAATTINRSPARYGAEFHACLLFLVAGLCFVSAASDLTTLYLGLEMVSIPTILLLAVSRRDNAGLESTLKYFALSAFSSAIFLMGCSYLFGVSGSTKIATIVSNIAADGSTAAYIAFALVLAGLAFRVTAVPFHFYAPDVFSGCSLPMGGLLSTLPKVAGFVAMIRLLGGPVLESGLAPVVLNTIVVLALITMTVGNLAALAQNNVRRMLAYSSVAHSGYLMIGLAAALVQGIGAQSVMMYLSAYIVMTLGFFAGVVAVFDRTDVKLDLTDLQGVTQRNLVLGAALTVCLLSLIGIPVTAGFWGKFMILRDLIAPENTMLLVGAIAMVVNSAIGAVYYLGMLVRVNGSANGESETNRVKANDSTAEISAAGQASLDLPAAATCVICAATTLLWFILPKWM